MGQGADIIYNIDEYYQIMLAATVSSGKSTLANALIGEDVLPAENQACTSKEIVVLNGEELPQQAWLRCGESWHEICALDRAKLEKLNKNESIDSIYIQRPIKGIGGALPIAIIDTPGVNNSLDARHMYRTLERLKAVKNGLIIYVINATQIGINDDRELLENILRHISGNAGIEILFAVNKSDEFDMERESISEVYEDIKKYILSCSFADALFDDAMLKYRIFFVSALNALILKKYLKQCSLSRLEMKVLHTLETIMADERYHFENYSPVILKNTAVQNTVESKYIQYLIHSGLPSIEQAINNYLYNRYAKQ